MGISSSTESKSRNEEISLLEHLDKLDQIEEGNPEEMPEKERAAVQAGADSILEFWSKELRALFPPKQGDSSEMDEDDQAQMRFTDFMEEGACKESFKALTDCMDDHPDRPIIRCKAHLPILKKCIDAHIHYYEPILTLAKTVERKMLREIIIPLVEQEEQELAAKNQQTNEPR